MPGTFAVALFGLHGAAAWILIGTAMARRRRTSDFDEFVELLSWLFSHISPWISIPVAVGGLFLIPAVMTAQIKTPLIVPAVQMLEWVFGGIWAVAWLAGGFGGWLRRRQQAAFLRQNIDIAWLNRLSWQEFENQIAKVYRHQGYHVEETGGGGSDGGVDLILTANGERTFVQCKQWRVFKVGVKPVRELYGVMSAEGAHRGILITSGVFTSEALRFAGGKRLELVDGAQCGQMVREFQQALGGQTGPNASVASPSMPPARPVCPVCGSDMVLKLAKRGAYAGSEFWGCSRWPKCDGIVNLDTSAG